MGIIDTLKRKYSESAQARQVSQDYRRNQSIGTKREMIGGALDKIANGVSPYKRVPVSYTKDGQQVTYYKQELRGQQKVSARTARMINALVPGANIRGQVQRQSRGTGSRGRPRGPSGRYIIPGKGAVGVYEWRKWARRQRAMERLQQGQQMAQQNPYSQQQYSQASQTPQNLPQQSQFQPQQQAISQPMPKYMGAPQPSQIQPPNVGISLWDNSFMKLDSGQSNVAKGGAMNQALNPELPVSNPQGDYYTEPDFFSGKQVLRKRSQDKLFKW